MPCGPRLHDEDPDDPLDAWEDPDADADDGDDDDATMTCPSCGAAIYDDTPRCPRCEQYLTPDLAPKHWWLVLGALAGIYAVLRWLF